MKRETIDFRLEAKRDVQNDSAIVYLYGDIVDERPKSWWSGEEVEGDFIIPAEVRSLFSDIAEHNIELHINSYGGSVFASVSIFNYIQSLNKNITVYIDGLAASGASLIAMVGNKLIMPKNTTMMIHRASSFCWGNCNDLRKVADTLEKLDNATVFETYKSKFKGSDDELKNLIDKETWITADEALAYGLCDEVMELKKAEEVEKITNEEISNAVRFMTNFGNLKVGKKEM